MLGAPTYYSLATDSSGGAFVDFSGPGVAFPAPASGILMSGSYALNASVTVSAFALDSNGAETVSAIPQIGMASVTFAAVDSPTLIQGTVLAGGIAMPDLLIEALESLVVVATTRTANDGSISSMGLRRARPFRRWPDRCCWHLRCCSRSSVGGGFPACAPGARDASDVWCSMS